MPVETNLRRLSLTVPQHACSIHPQGWVPVETSLASEAEISVSPSVAFTPKGGCPLKRGYNYPNCPCGDFRSIHPQGWVPVETYSNSELSSESDERWVAFTPKGGCPLKRIRMSSMRTGI